MAAHRRGTAWFVIAILVAGVALLTATAGSDPRTGILDTTPPIANAGPDQTVQEDSRVSFDGSASSDDVGIVNYTWTALVPIGHPRQLWNVSVGGSLAEFDPVRPYVYVLGGREVQALNLTTGVVDQTYAINHTAQYALSMAVARDGTYLVVGIPTGDRGYYNFGPYQSYFASVDLANRTKIGEFFVDEDAYKVLVTSDGSAIIAGGSGQGARLRMFNARNGTQAPNASWLWQYSDIAMHPSERRMYSVDEYGLNPPHVYRYSVDPGGGVLGTWWWPYHGEYDPGSRIWANPAGDLLLTGSGLLLASRDDPNNDMALLARLVQGRVQAVAFDATLGLVAIAEMSRLSFFDTVTYQLVASQDLGMYPDALAFRGDDIYLFGGGHAYTMKAPRKLLYGIAPTHTFTEPGTSVVTLRVRDAANNTDTDTVTITVTDITPPIADAGSDQAIIHGTFVTFDGSASTDNVGTTGWTWTFQDATPRSLFGPNPRYRFDNLGTFVVTLTVTDAAGNRGTDTVTITASLDPIPPSVDAGPDQVVFKGATVVLEGTATDNIAIASWTWAFDDGGPQTLTGPRVSHRFAKAGTFDVTLTVADPDGNSALDSVQVIVRDFTLVTQSHVPKGFRIGVPDDWTTQLDYSSPGFRADLFAHGPTISGVTVSVAVSTQEDRDVRETDAYLVGLAQTVIHRLQEQGGAVVVRSPVLVDTVNTRAALFEVSYGNGFLHEVWGIVASESRERVWTIVAQAGRDAADLYRPVIDAVVRSFEVIPPSFMENPRMVLGIVSILAVAIAAVLVALLARWFVRWRKRPRAARPVPPAYVMMSAAQPMISAPFAQAFPEPPLEPRPRYCWGCGAVLAPQYPSCIMCGRAPA
ncbi:MAG: PKD domain-containing protein [Methanobacteriota archaeon]|nr:MAG: PKD domain-containing protein [Euryarchaeota archaeon]